MGIGFSKARFPPRVPWAMVVGAGGAVLGGGHNGQCMIALYLHIFPFFF